MASFRIRALAILLVSLLLPSEQRNVYSRAYTKIRSAVGNKTCRCALLFSIFRRQACPTCNIFLLPCLVPVLDQHGMPLAPQNWPVIAAVGSVLALNLQTVRRVHPVI